MPAHLEFLEKHRDRIRAAGPLRESDGTPAGGLWLAWSQVFVDGRRLI
jgi:uncharacterized protein